MTNFSLANPQKRSIKFRVWYNGKSWVRLDESENTYSKIDVPGNFDLILNYIINTYQLQLLPADFLYTDTAVAFKEYLIYSNDLGRQNVKDFDCHHLSFEGAGGDWQLWAEADALPVPRSTTAEREGQRPSASEVRCTDLLPVFLLLISRLALDLASSRHARLS